MRCPLASISCRHPTSRSCVLIESAASRADRSLPISPEGFAAPERLARTHASLWSRLSRREAEVAELAVRGLRSKAIARELTISPYTARNHLKAIFRKLEIGSQVELMALRAKL